MFLLKIWPPGCTSSGAVPETGHKPSTKQEALGCRRQPKIEATVKRYGSPSAWEIRVRYSVRPESSLEENYGGMYGGIYGVIPKLWEMEPASVIQEKGIPKDEPRHRKGGDSLEMTTSVMMLTQDLSRTRSIIGGVFPESPVKGDTLILQPKRLPKDLTPPE